MNTTCKEVSDTEIMRIKIKGKSCKYRIFDKTGYDMESQPDSDVSWSNYWHVKFPCDQCIYRKGK